MIDTTISNTDVFKYLFKYPNDELAQAAFERINKNELTDQELLSHKECEEFVRKHEYNAIPLVSHARHIFYPESVMHEKEGSKRIPLEVKDKKLLLGDAIWDASGWNSKYDLLDFVIMPNYELRIGLKHFWMADAATFVYGAGRMIVSREGDVEYIDNHSGHYTPTEEQFKRSLKLLDYINIKHTYTRTIWE